jgi:lysophospholipase L1-like esterase
MKIQPNSRLLFIGDSITDCGRKRPIGEGAFDGALGNGYVSLIDAALASGYPDYGIKIINMGVSGNTVFDLKYRWASDVLALQPDWLSVLIGINDVWQKISQPVYIGHNEFAHEFAYILDELIQQVRPYLQGLILMTPYYLETNLEDPMRS